VPEEHHLELNPKKTFTYRVVASLIIGIAQVLFRPTVKGRENIPLEGPVLIAPIHRSNVDFAFTLFMSRRKVFFMAGVYVGGARYDVRFEALNVAAGTASGHATRLRGKGMAGLRGGRGDMLVRLLVWVPTKLTGAERKLLEELRRGEGFKAPRPSR